MDQIQDWNNIAVLIIPSHLCTFSSIWCVGFETRSWSEKCLDFFKKDAAIIEIRTWVSVSLSCLDNCIRFETDRYLFFSNSFSKALIWAAVKAVRGRFLRSSFDRDVSSSPEKKVNFCITKRKKYFLKRYPLQLGVFLFFQNSIVLNSRKL